MAAAVPKVRDQPHLGFEGQAERFKVEPWLAGLLIVHDSGPRAIGGERSYVVRSSDEAGRCNGHQVSGAEHAGPAEKVLLPLTGIHKSETLPGLNQQCRAAVEEVDILRK